MIFGNDEDMINKVRSAFEVLNGRNFDVFDFKSSYGFEIPLAKIEPDVIISEANMDGGPSGLDILDACPDTTYRLLLSNDQENLRAYGLWLENREIDFISKPCSPRLLYHAIVNATRKLEVL